jgi:hypothetical protein
VEDDDETSAVDESTPPAKRLRKPSEKKRQVMEEEQKLLLQEESSLATCPICSVTNTRIVYFASFFDHCDHQCKGGNSSIERWTCHLSRCSKEIVAKAGRFLTLADIRAHLCCDDEHKDSRESLSIRRELFSVVGRHHSSPLL